MSFRPLSPIAFRANLSNFGVRNHHVVGHAVGAGPNGQQVEQVETRSESKYRKEYTHEWVCVCVCTASVCDRSLEPQASISWRRVRAGEQRCVYVICLSHWCLINERATNNRNTCVSCCCCFVWNLVNEMAVRARGVASWNFANNCDGFVY